jgi:DNA polymerase
MFIELFMIMRLVKTPLKHVATCEACNLHWCQRPLLDGFRRADVMWVGLSAKKLDRDTSFMPLAPETPTGSILQEIEGQLLGVRFYKTNLVKCPPLDADGKLRYPDQEEMGICFNNLEYEIRIIRPAIIVLLGLKVANFCFPRLFGHKTALPDNFGYQPKRAGKASFIPVHHPSFINVYRKKQQAAYRNSVGRLIESLLGHAEAAVA